MLGPKNRDTGKPAKRAETAAKDAGETPPYSRELEPVWKDIISGKAKFEFEFFAARILQGTLARTFKKNPSPENLAKCARELRDLFLKNADRPSASRDLEKILG